MEKEYDFLRKNLNYLFQLSVVSNKLRLSYASQIEPPLDKILISSTARTLIQGVASLFDPIEDKRGNKNIVAQLIHNIDFKNYAATIKKIDTIRNKIISHNDLESNLKADDFISEVNLTIEEVEELLLHIIKSLEKIIGQKMPIEDLEKKCITALEHLFKL